MVEEDTRTDIIFERIQSYNIMETSRIIRYDNLHDIGVSKKVYRDVWDGAKSGTRLEIRF